MNQIALNKFERLPAPIVPAAQHDGLLNIEYLTGDIEIIIPLWEHARPGDYYGLQINDMHVLPSPALPDPLPVGDLTMHIAGTLFEDEGIYHIRYAAKNVENGVVELSDAATIRVDRTAPGAALLAPVMFRDSPPCNVVRALVPGYAHMAEGDVIKTFLNGMPGPVYQVTRADLTTRIIEIVFSKPFLMGLGSGSVRLTYCVRDRAGNRSIDSEPAELSGLKPENVDWTPSGGNPGLPRLDTLGRPSS